MTRRQDEGLRSIFRKQRPKFHWESIESPITGKGIPDSNYCYDGVEGWVEFKKITGHRIKSLVSEQTAWHERRARAGGLTFFAARRYEYEYDMLYIWPGPIGRRLLSETVEAVPALYCSDGGPAYWEWDKIGAILIPARLKRKKFLSSRGK